MCQARLHHTANELGNLQKMCVHFREIRSHYLKVTLHYLTEKISIYLLSYLHVKRTDLLYYSLSLVLWVLSSRSTLVWIHHLGAKLPSV